MAGQEVGVVYVHVEPSAKGFSKNLSGEFATASGDIAASTKGWGKSLASSVGGAFGKIGKIGLGAVSAIGGSLLGLAAKGGFDRALAIENAQAKLKGLHHDTASIETIMGNALAAVKGTAFGLGDAVTVAASLSASGVKGGQEMEYALKAVADTASIAGMSMQDAGAIFGSVAARGKLQGDDMLQLSSRGVPVLAALAQQTGKTSEEVSDMVSKGQIDFKTFADAMTKYVGGAALAAGETTEGALKNLKAALGRLGADVAAEGLSGFRELLNHATPAVDALTSAVKPLSDQLGAKMQPVIETVCGLMDRLTEALESGQITIESITSTLGGLAGGFGVLAAVGGNFDGILNGIATMSAGAQQGLDTFGAMLRTAPGKWQSTIDGWGKGFESGGEKIKAAIGSYGDMFGPVADKITSGLSKVGSSISASPLGRATDALKTQLVGGLGTIKSGVTSKLADVASSFSNNPVVASVQSMGSKIGGALGGIAGNAKSLLAPLGGAFSGIGDAIGGPLQSGLTKVGGMVTSFFSPGNFMRFVGIGGLVAALVAGLGMLDSSMGGQLSAMIERFAAQGPQMIEQFAARVTAALPQLMTAGGQMITSLLTAVTANLPVLLQAGGQIVLQLVSGLAAQLPTMIPAAVQMVLTLVQGLVAQLPLLLDAGMQLLLGLVQGVINSLPQLIAMLPQIISTFVNGIVTQLPMILTTGMQLLVALINGIVEAIPQLIAMLPTIITNTVRVLMANLPAIIQAGVQILVALINGLVRAIPQLVGYLPQIIATTVSTLMANLPAIIQAGVQILVALIRGLAQAIPQLIAMLPRIVQSIKNGFSQVNWGEVGSQIINGIIGGIGAMAGALWDAAVNVAKGALDKAKAWLHIKSPSRRFRDEVGKQIGAGMVVGIEATEGDVAKAGQALAEASLPTTLPTPRFDASELQRATAGLTATYSATVSPSATSDPTLESILATLEALVGSLPRIISTYTPTVGRRDLSRMVA